jgi:hypothetical protein
MSRNSLSKEESRKFALEIEILVSKICQVGSEVNHPALDEAIENLLLSQSAILRSNREEVYRRAYDPSNQLEYAWLEQEFNRAWEV